MSKAVSGLLSYGSSWKVLHSALNLPFTIKDLSDSVILRDNLPFRRTHLFNKY